jgi:uncharacterized protein YndB with AHSA1/START domain
MATPLFVENSIAIDAPKANVWDALINPEQTKKYMFGCEAVSDWQVGSPILWKGIFDGHELVAVKGSIVKLEPETFLAYTTIDPNSGIDDIPQNYLTVNYDLAAKDGQTILTVTQGDYSTVADGENRYNDTISDGGWSSVLTEIKNLVEVS